MRIFSLHVVPIGEVPSSFPLRLVIVEFPFEGSSIREDPLASDEIALLPSAEHLHASLLKYKCALALLGSVRPES